MVEGFALKIEGGRLITGMSRIAFMKKYWRCEFAERR